MRYYWKYDGNIVDMSRKHTGFTENDDLITQKHISLFSLGTKWDLPKWKCTGLRCGYYGICDMHNEQYGCYEDLGY